MRDRIDRLLAIGLICVLAFLIFLLVGTESEKVYTRISIVSYEAERVAAIKGDIHEAARCLKSVVDYQSSKVSAEGQLGRALKLVRQGTIREIIARMRSLSGEELGDDPEPWIKKYYRKDNSRPNQPEHPAQRFRQLLGLRIMGAAHGKIIAMLQYAVRFHDTLRCI